jgi:hypothetical protein
MHRLENKIFLWHRTAAKEVGWIPTATSEKELWK